MQWLKVLILCGEDVGSNPAGKLFTPQKLSIHIPNPSLPPSSRTAKLCKQTVFRAMLLKGSVSRAIVANQECNRPAEDIGLVRVVHSSHEKTTPYISNS